MAKIIFLGDIAAPFDVNGKNIHNAEQVFSSKHVVVNLEGALVEGDCSKKNLFNHPSILQYLSKINTVLASGANNHMFDVSSDCLATEALLKKQKIAFCGAGNSLSEASKPIFLELQGKKVCFLACGWSKIGCVIAKTKKSGVNAFNIEDTLRQVKKLHENNPDASIVLLVHWGYELELYPLPLHREFAFQLVDAGVSLIIGAHSHCVQGIEVYKGVPIVYGLGNWFLPSGFFWGGKLNFPSYTHLQLAFEWGSSDGSHKCHWHKYDPQNCSVNFIESEDLGNSQRVMELTPFQGMCTERYVYWFKKHRIKKKLLPVYHDVNCPWKNRLRDGWLTLRTNLVKIIRR